MKSVYAFVNKENYTVFSCPNCEHTHRISVAKLQGKKHSIVAKCTCNERFEVRLNFRQFYRKSVNLVGKVLNVSSGADKWLSMIVLDISMTGIRFKAFGTKGIEKGHRLHVRFTLDDPHNSEIDKEVRVVDIKNDTCGCEFLNLAYEEKMLGYYLFPNYSSS
jgi:hypothetical protein